MVFCAIFSMVAVFTLESLGRAANVRTIAQTRAQLAIIAQNQLETARAIPAGKLTAGTSIVTDPKWPENSRCKVILEPQSDTTWKIDVVAENAGFLGTFPVRISTLRQGVQK